MRDRKGSSEGGKKRIWEIEYLRVLAILLMLIYHTAYDLSEFAGWAIDFGSGFWFWYGKLASIFLFVSGVSSGFSRKSTVKKGLRLLLIGLGITAVTYLVLGDQYVRYGVLHFLGTCLILYPLLRKLSPPVLAVLAAAIFLLARPLEKIEAATGLFLPLGIKYPGFSSADYFPLVPYLGVYILGIIAYKLYYHKGRSLFPFDWGNKYVTAVSRHSLAIYILHQPVLLGAVLLLKKIKS
mgnify:CR=1 FL=1|jgi:uncharacterized membrane protein